MSSTQIGLRRHNVTIAASGQHPLAGLFDGFRITSLTDGATLTLQVDEGEDLRMYKGMAWLRDERQAPWKRVLLKNGGASPLTVELYLFVGGELRDDRVILDSSSPIAVKPRTDVLATAIAHDSTTAPATTTAIVAAAAGVTVRLAAGLTVWSDGAPGSYALLRTTSGLPILGSYGGAVVLPQTIDLPADVGLEVHQAGRATVYGTRGTA